MIHYVLYARRRSKKACIFYSQLMHVNCIFGLLSWNPEICERYTGLLLGGYNNQLVN